MKQKILQLLAILSDAECHSGETLAQQLGVTRVAINKSIKKIEQMGLVIDAKHGRGYQLQKKIELLDQKQIKDLLGSHAKAQACEINILFETGSTNDELSRVLTHDASNVIVLLAEYQNEGKGRRNNSWLSPVASGIYLSMSWKVEVANNFTSIMSLVTGVAIIRTLHEIGITDAGLKWPNDILVDGKKLGGVLLEMKGEAGGPLSMVIGIGLNYDMSDNIAENVAQPITDICQQTETRLSRNVIIAMLINQLIEALSMTTAADTTAMLDEWRNYDCCHGKKATLQLPDSSITGNLQGIDEQGRLLIEHQGEIKRYLSGEVSVMVGI